MWSFLLSRRGFLSAHAAKAPTHVLYDMLSSCGFFDIRLMKSLGHALWLFINFFLLLGYFFESFTFLVTFLFVSRFFLMKGVLRKFEWRW